MAAAILVMAGLVPAIPIIAHSAILIGIAGTSPAMTRRVLASDVEFADEA